MEAFWQVCVSSLVSNPLMSQQKTIIEGRKNFNSLLIVRQTVPWSIGFSANLCFVSQVSSNLCSRFLTYEWIELINENYVRKNARLMKKIHRSKLRSLLTN